MPDEGQEDEVAGPLSPWPIAHLGPRALPQQDIVQNDTSFFPCGATAPPWKTNMAPLTLPFCHPCYSRPPQPQTQGGTGFAVKY